MIWNVHKENVRDAGDSFNKLLTEQHSLFLWSVHCIMASRDYGFSLCVAFPLVTITMCFCLLQHVEQLCLMYNFHKIHEVENKDCTWLHVPVWCPRTEKQTHNMIILLITDSYSMTLMILWVLTYCKRKKSPEQCCPILLKWTRSLSPGEMSQQRCVSGGHPSPSSPRWERKSRKRGFINVDGKGMVHYMDLGYCVVPGSAGLQSLVCVEVVQMDGRIRPTTHCSFSGGRNGQTEGLPLPSWLISCIIPCFFQRPHTLLAPHVPALHISTGIWNTDGGGTEWKRVRERER